MNVSAKRLLRSLRSREPVLEGFYWNLYDHPRYGMVQVYTDLSDDRFAQLTECHRRALAVPGVIHAIPERVRDGAVIRWDGWLPGPGDWRVSDLLHVVQAIRGLHAAGVLLNDGVVAALDPLGQTVICDLSNAWVLDGSYPATAETYRQDFQNALNGWLARLGYPAAELVAASRLGAALNLIDRGKDVLLGWLWSASDWFDVAARCAQRAASCCDGTDQAGAHYEQAMGWVERMEKEPDPLASWM